MRMGILLLLLACSKAVPWVADDTASSSSDTGTGAEEGDADVDTDTDSAFAGLVTLNELVPEPDDDGPDDLEEDWIELYNATSSTIDLAGWGLTDEPESGEFSWLEEDTLLAPRGFLVLTASGDVNDGELGFKLSSEGETLWLVDAEGMLVDAVTFPETDEGQAYARVPDGGEYWVLTVSPTPGRSNGS